ncbi:ATP-binding protein [Streptomyces kunmingensis]|uniref:ATP-binding protein n=1 Tax=Streptomyces kunmingensis TaxID=68225 RepID=A0ABU6CCY9_9ACTN|nr:ATP-binding protein [Streptomyces kunmingensis]MEB3962568.1 ATP-binding protein [Streptomyces kunmingensis]
MLQQNCVCRKPWELAFTAEPEELAGLRRIVRLHLMNWGLHDLVDHAQLCVTEMVSNVITHVGTGTPTELSMLMNGAFLRIEVQDPDLRALPTLLHAADDDESGRGMRLLDAVSVRWGVLIKADRKVTWCELAAGIDAPEGHVRNAAVDRAEELLQMYGVAGLVDARSETRVDKLVAVALITDLLCWASAHGYDADEVLESAEARLGREGPRR